jgi:hypothetical protein
MDKEHLHSLVKKLIAASKRLTEAARKFGENSLQAQEADAVYMAASAQFQRESYWERLLKQWFTSVTGSTASTTNAGWSYGKQNMFVAILKTKVLSSTGANENKL